MDYRHTKIIFTVGPATREPEMLRSVISAGASVCRLNMAHASHDWCREVVRDVRRISQDLGASVAIMMDVKGPEVRTGPREASVTLEPGQQVVVVAGSDSDEWEDSDRLVIETNYPGLANDLSVGDTVLIDNGLIRLRVETNDGKALGCEVLNQGVLGSRRHINLPGITTQLPAMTQKDREDAEVGVELGVDYFAMSFVRQADDLDLMRRFLSERESSARIIAKIEDQSAIENLEEIVKASDGLMVARGDLGIEVSFERLPLIQRRAVELCLHLGRPVIVATHLLESMIQSPVPTRAEITDVANGVTERADCLMLSGETTVGKYPVRCVEIMDRTIRSIEGHLDVAHNDQLLLRTSKAKILRSAVVLAEDLGGVGIVVFTRNGYLARVLSLLRPLRSPIYAFTDEPAVFQELGLLWGVCPLFMPLAHDPEQVLTEAFGLLRERGFVAEDSEVVAITNVLSQGRILDTIQLRPVSPDAEAD